MSCSAFGSAIPAKKIQENDEQIPHPATISPLDSARGLPHSAVMIVAMSSVAATTASYHLRGFPINAYMIQHSMSPDGIVKMLQCRI